MTAIPNEPTQRWAIVKTIRAGDDLHGARQVIINTQIRPAKDGQPDFYGARNCPEVERQTYSAEKIGPDAMIGMMRGGPVCQVDGWG